MISGIYKILNKITNKYYIGSAVNLEHRKRQHFFTLKERKHRNRYLQNSYNLYGKDKFEFIILELCEKEKLIEREQIYIDTLDSCNPNKGYNIAKKAGSNLGLKHSQETIDKLKKFSGPNHHLFGKKRPEETRRNISLAKIGSKNPRFGKPGTMLGAKRTDTDQTSLIKRTKHKLYNLISPEGKIFNDIKNLSKFCREHNLDNRCLYLVLNNKRPSHRGWRKV